MIDQPGVRATLSAVRLAQGRAGEALAAAEDAMARIAAMGGYGLFRGAFERLAHAEALHATGAHDAARRAIADARARLFAIANTIPDPDYEAGAEDAQHVVRATETRHERREIVWQTAHRRRADFGAASGEAAGRQ